MVPDAILRSVTELLQTKIDAAVTIKSFSFSGGGCINHGGELKTSSRSFFVKWNDVSKYPGMFKQEAKGLTLLSSTNTTRIPSIIGFGSTNTQQFIVLEFIKASLPSKRYWKLLGEQLAALHRNTNENFGLDHNNYIGSLRQFNEVSTSWIEFFIEKRLSAQLKLAVDSGTSDLRLIKKFEELFRLLPEIIPTEQPALLHGDLWNGNLITDDKGNPCLIDPAVYYGNREAEIAFTRLFGAFNEEFYNIYNESFPLQKNFNDRIDVYNLYPLLVHANLFGDHYLNQVYSILNSVL
jgi:protein-ribulosamine 3-kinase